MDEIELVQKLLSDNEWSLTRTYEAIQQVSPAGDGGVGIANGKRARNLYAIAKELVAFREDTAAREHEHFERILENPLAFA